MSGDEEARTLTDDEVAKRRLAKGIARTKALLSEYRARLTLLRSGLDRHRAPPIIAVSD